MRQAAETQSQRADEREAVAREHVEEARRERAGAAERARRADDPDVDT